MTRIFRIPVLLLAVLPGLAAPISAQVPIESLLVRAARAREAGEALEAAALYSRILERDPEHRVALYNAGIILENAGKPDLAAGVWQRALAADGADVFAYEHLFRNLAVAGDLEPMVGALNARVMEAPDDKVARIALVLALQAAGRWDESVGHVERYLLAHPESNIAYALLKDAFVSRVAYLDYVRNVSRRAATAGALENLKLLNVRLLLERGRFAEARALVGSTTWSSDRSRTLLTRAGLLAPELLPVPAPRPVAEAAPPPGEEPPAEPEPAPAPAAPPEREEPPDFGPDDPRSAELHLDRTEAALEERDESRAVAELRRVLHAAPLRLQPRILLALLLDQNGDREAARGTLRGPVETSPWDLYQQAWRTIRDDYFDPDHNGQDVYKWRELARARVQTVDDAKVQVRALLRGLNDPYAHLFEPREFAGYLLAPNANRMGGPRPAGLKEITDPWVPVPVEGAEKKGLPERGHSLLLKPSVDPGNASGPEESPEPEGDSPPAVAEAETGAETPLPPSPSPLPRDPGLRAVRLPDGVGYLALPSLAGLSLPVDVEQALEALGEIRGLILDLRGNGGGDGGIAVEVAARFLPRGSEVCTYVTRRGPEKRATSWEFSRRPTGPLVILVDRATASAAELLAAALRDQAGATLMGRPTAGKGVGQKALLLPDGSGISLTRFRLLPPSGESWDGAGLQPAILLDRPEETGDMDGAVERARALVLSLSSS
jgi:tetratricopeptide (TPR) repeat protein